MHDPENTRGKEQCIAMPKGYLCQLGSGKYQSKRLKGGSNGIRVVYKTLFCLNGTGKTLRF